MKLSIVTINYNDAKGLERTLKSVASQTYTDFEHVIVDGASTDGSVEVIRDYASKATSPSGHLATLPITVRWISEPDKGIYNAMNKGILMASGDYIQILNSGDILASNTVIQQMSEAIHRIIATSPLSHLATSSSNESAALPELMYGNMLKMDYASGKVIGKSGEVPYSLLNYFTSTMNHDCCWIRRSLFVPTPLSPSIHLATSPNDESRCFGLYDENLKIVSDWKWFLCAIALGINPSSHLAISPIRPIYVDIDMTIFDTSGISERNLQLRNEERRKVLEEVLPPAILADYDKHTMDMHQMDNLRKHPWAYRLVWTMERVLNRIDNKNFKKPKSK